MAYLILLCNLNLCVAKALQKSRTVTMLGMLVIITVKLVFFEILKFREWLIFGFFMILFSRMGLPKAHILQSVVGFFQGVKFHE